MKYYCIGDCFPLVKLAYSKNFFDNLPLIGTPIFGKLPITQERMQTAFETTNEFIVCKNLDDVKQLRFFGYFNR